MKRFLTCRRTFVAVISIAAVTFIGIHNTIDVSGAISMIAIGIAGANAAQGAMEARKK
jgi:hypothetical protein